MEKNFKIMKVFDCQEMPQDVRNVFFEKCGSPSFRGSNDCLVSWYCYSEYKCISGKGDFNFLNIDNEPVPYDTYNGNEILAEKMSGKRRLIVERGDNIVSDWLFDNGAKLWEEVIVKHWW